MAKFDRNQIKDGWEKTLHIQTDTQTEWSLDREPRI